MTLARKVIPIFLLALASCEDDGGNACSDPRAVMGSIISSPTREPVTADLLVRGVITAPSNATVYAVQVDGVDATNSGVDFRNWTVTIPLGVLAAESQEGVAMLSAIALTNCGIDPIAVGTQSVQVDATPGIVVNQLKVTPAIPNGQTYLPSSKPVSAILTIGGNPQSAGTVVELATTLGTLAADKVVLVGNGTVDAVGQVLFSSTTPGTAIITASAMGKTGVGAVTVIGPPTFAPDGATITAGGSLPITVLSTGRIDSCQATPAQGIHVTSGSSDLMAGTGGSDQTGDGLIDLAVTVDATLATQVSTTVSCRDPFGQLGTATFLGKP